MEWIHLSAETIGRPPCTEAWCLWLRDDTGEDFVFGWVMTFADRAGYYLARNGDNFTPIAGPFDDLDQAKVAYLLIFGGS